MKSLSEIVVKTKCVTFSPHTQETYSSKCAKKQRGMGHYFPLVCQGIARTQSPTNKNYAPELPTFGAIARVSPTGVQWKGLALGEPPSRSRYPLCQVSMLSQSPSLAYKQTEAWHVWCDGKHCKCFEI